MLKTKPKSLIPLVALFFIASLIQYSLSLRNGFVWDAESAFTQDSSIRELSNLPSAFTKPPFDFNVYEGKNLNILEYYRPVIKVLHILEYQVFANKPLGYKAVNVMLNAVVVVLFFLFVHAATKNTYVTVLATALYTVSPVRAEAVYWTYADGYLIAALFSLLALISYQRGRIILGLAAYTFALLSHETAVMLPVIVLLYAWLIERRRHWQGYLPAMLFFGVTLIYVALRTIIIGPTSLTRLDAVTWLNSIVVMLQRFVKIFFVPDATITLYPDYFFSSLTLEVVISYMVIIGLIGLAVFLFFKRRNYLFWYLWFFVWLAISFNLGQYGSFLMSDKLLYLAAGGFAVLIGLFAYELTARRAVATALAGLLVVMHSAMVFAKAPYWHDTQVYLEKALEFTPGFYLAHYSLGYTYVKQREFDKALEQFKLVVQTNPAMSLAHNNMGNIYYLRREFDKAQAAWQKAIDTDPQNPQPYYNIGLIYYKKGDLANALATFEQYMAKTGKPDSRVVEQVEQLRKQLNSPGTK